MEAPRRRADVGFLAVVLTMCLQLGGLVWGAAKVDSALRTLEAVTAELKAGNAARDLVQLDHERRILLLEEKRRADDRRTADIERRIYGGGE